MSVLITTRNGIEHIMSDIISFNDWFLPSKDELNAMYTELKVYGLGSFSDINNGYWSSSETTTTQVWAIRFLDGVINGAGLKTASGMVRAIRLFTSITNYNLRDTGPAGGYIFWKSGNDYLEAAPSDFVGLFEWSNVTATLIGITAQGTVIGTGQANTTAIINQVGHTDSAAKLCDDLVI